MRLSMRLVVRPSKAFLDVVRARVRPAGAMEGAEVGAVLLVQGQVVDAVAALDVATKAAAVGGAELVGNCPQQLNTVVFWGDVAAVKQAMAALEAWASRE